MGAPGTHGIAWPDGKRFAFSVIDDTDGCTVEQVAPVYDFLLDLGIVTTKTVWPLTARNPRPEGGQSLEEPEYRAWVLSLQERGVEIASHGAANEPSTRERTILGLELFRDVVGRDPRIYTVHVGQRDGLYWGSARLDGPARIAYRLTHGVRGSDNSTSGHIEQSPFYWGDLCRTHISYVRNLVFSDIDTLAQDPIMPYHDPARPCVPMWFSASDGARIASFLRLTSERNQDRLAASGGACIAYTHFAYGFTECGRPHPEFRRLMERLAGLGGWFVPVSTLLDHLKTRPDWKPEVDRRRLARMQWKWLLGKLRTGTT
ncbi:MAG TPA: hypothetical protein VLH79_04790 [Chthonomonadales bacterium]|nr:hypothetical protein [Chthonomonadales bacterium]